MLRSWILFACCLALLIPSAGFGADGLTGFQVRFGLNSTEVAPRYRVAIAQLAGYLKSHPQTRVALAGHTDASGPLALNVRLSHDRAAAVRDLLVNDYGISKGRVGIAWLDSSRPVADNDSLTGMARNRRVGIAFISTGFSTAVAKAPVAQRPAPVPPRLPASRRPAARPATQPKQQSGSTDVASKAQPAMKANLLEELALHYAQGSLRPNEGAEGLQTLANKVLANQDRMLKIEGFSQGPNGGLQLARKRVDAIRARIVYVFKVPVRQVHVSWSGGPSVTGGDAGVGVMVKMFGPH